MADPKVNLEEADEATIRAREAVIASGQFPGTEDQIRAGLHDDLEILQIARRGIVDMSIPVEQLKSRYVYYAIPAPTYSENPQKTWHPLQRFIAWLFAPAMRYYAHRVVKEQKGNVYRDRYKQIMAEHKARMDELKLSHQERMLKLSLESKANMERIWL